MVGMEVNTIIIAQVHVSKYLILKTGMYEIQKKQNSITEFQINHTWPIGPIYMYHFRKILIQKIIKICLHACIYCQNMTLLNHISLYNLDKYDAKILKILLFVNRVVCSTHIFNIFKCLKAQS